MFQTLKMIPAKILSIPGELLGILAFGVGAVLLFLVPFIDKAPEGRRGRWVTHIGWFVVAYMVGLTILGYLWPAGK
jgi:quinol-cytochrome oxidoreductase complex cytochrome b subunit